MLHKEFYSRLLSQHVLQSMYNCRVHSE